MSIVRNLAVSVLVCTFLALPADVYSQKKSKKPNPDSPFAKIEDKEGLPRVLIIGDSISIGYTLPTRKLLEGKVNLHRVPSNAGHTGMGIANVPKWVAEENGKWDVIHFNWGLWDLCYRNPESKNQGKRDKVNGTITYTPEEYAANLEKIVTELEKTGAKLIFATTTPVPEGEAGRKVGDDVRYNEAALEVMKRHNIAIDDLHAVMADKMEKYQTQPGNVHFKLEGSQLLAENVAKSIIKALDK